MKVPTPEPSSQCSGKAATATLQMSVRPVSVEPVPSFKRALSSLGTI